MAKAKKENKNNKNKKSFFKSFKAELKKVTWPTPKQLANNTVAVITIVLLTAIIVFVLDVTFEAGNKYGIEKIKSLVSNSQTEEKPEENNNEGESSEEVKSEENKEENKAEENSEQKENVENK